MTEYDLAFGFLQCFVKAAAAAASKGRSLDDFREYRGFCDQLGVAPTATRMELARDAAEVVKECLALVRDEAGDTRLIPEEDLVAGLERYGWRVDFLNKDVRV